MVNNPANEIMKKMAQAAPSTEPQPEVEPTLEVTPETEPTPEVVEEISEETPEETPETPPVVEGEETPENPDGDEQVPEAEAKVEEQSLDLDNIDAWTEGEVEESDSAVDYSEIGKDLGFEGVKTKDEFINKVNEKVSSLEQRVEELSKNVIPDNIPEALKDAIELSKSGGDYLAYLQVGSVDYDAFNDIDLVANSIADYFVKDGKVDEDALDAHLDSLTDEQIRIEAAKIRTAGKSHQAAQRQAYIDKAKERKEKITNEVSNALSKFESFSGFKVMPHQKDYIKKAFNQDQVIQALMYTNGKFDADKAIKSVFRVKYGDQMDSYLKSKIKNQTKKEIVESVSNVEVQVPSSAPDVPSPEVKSGLDSWVQRLKGTSS